jgi:hypothetical protein
MMLNPRQMVLNFGKLSSGPDHERITGELDATDGIKKG